MLSSLPATAICGVGVAYLVLRASCNYLWGVLYEHNLREATVVRDLPRLAETPSASRGRTCVVIGGSLAGCIAAGAMAKMFDTVVLIDPLIDEEEPKRWRTQVAQLNQVHGFLPTAVQGLQLIFPGAFEKAVMRRGGRLLSMSESPMENLFNHGYVKYDRNLATIIAGKSDSLPMSRWTLQQVVRELVRDTPSVVMTKGRVTRFKYREASVCGVLFDDADGVEKPLDCDLVLDCSGPKRAFRKLIAGHPRFREPALTVYNLPMTYSTAIFDIHPSLVDRMPVPDSIKTQTTSWRDLGGVSMVLPHLTQVGDFHMMYRGEGNKRRFTLGTNMFTSERGRSYDEVPATIDAYRRAWKSSHFAQTGQEKEAWFDETMDLLEESDRLHVQATPFFKLRETQSYAYQIDASGDGGKRGLPDNLAIVGDAFAKLNPTFGQGCSKAMADVATLYTSLLDHERIADAVCDFDRRRQARTMAMFETNMVFDFGFESVQKANPAHPSSKGQLMRWFSKGFLNAIIKTKDPNLGNSFVGVTLGALPPLELMRPSHIALSLFARRFWDCSP